MESLDHLRDEILRLIRQATSLDALEQARIAILGRKGRVTELMKGLGALDGAERRERGQALNRLKGEVEEAIGHAARALEDEALRARLAEERVDVSLPVRAESDGRVHPISQTIDEIVAIFGEMGFTVAEGPDIEDDFHNFTALNIPPEHPARQEHDTFYLPEQKDGSRKVLRTHTSPVQVRTMLQREAADPHHRARPHLPQRSRRDPFADVPPGRGAGHRRGDAYGASEGLPDRVLPRLLRYRRPAGALPAELLPLHRALGRGRYRLLARRRRAQDRRRRRLAGDPGLRHGASQGAGELRHRSRALSGLRLRHGDRAHRHAEIRHPRSAHLLRQRSALAPALRLPAARRAVDGRRARRDEVDARLAEDASRDRRHARRDRRHAGDARARGRRHREPRQGSGALPRRPRGFGRAASQCRQAPPLPRRYRHRDGAGGVRRAQCARRHARRLRASGRHHPAQRHGAEGRA